MPLTGATQMEMAGRASAGASISLSKLGGTVVCASGRSSEKGEFEFKEIAPGKYRLKVTLEGY